MNERAQRIGQIALVAALVGGMGYGLHQAGVVSQQREDEFDNRCGGPTRPDCVRIEKRVLVPHFDGTAGSIIIVDFVPKPTPTSTPTELGNGK